MDGLKLDEIYSLRDNFLVIGLTGKNSAGCTKIANLLSIRTFDEFLEKNGNRRSVEPKYNNFKHNSERKYRIVYNFLKDNWKPFKIINYNKVLFYIIMNEPFDDFINFLSNFKDKLDFSKEIVDLKTLKDDYLKIQNKRFKQLKNISTIFTFVGKAKNFDVSKNIDYLQLYYTFYTPDFHTFSNRVHKILKKYSQLKRIKLLERISENLRKSGKPFVSEQSEEIHVHDIVQLINRLIIAWKFLGDKKRDARIVIDSLRNSLEVMYLKERHSGFYCLSVNMEEERRLHHLKQKYKNEFEDVKNADDFEYKGDFGKFYMQDVRNCIQNSDIHLHNITDIESKKLTNNEQISKEYKLNIKQQIIQYISLILQPGIITPSPEERCMQIAYVAKSNSGCISRQVGAVVTDKNYSIRGIGWNSSPENQVPCLLRSMDDYLIGNDKDAFSEYELHDTNFKNEVKKYYDTAEVNENKQDNLCGRNMSFCFREIQNSIKEGKNQIHTRSLHAEENAFLQITKYGGIGINKGILFTTASPCELCAKKAYQLGIEKIYYVDPYPGISESHILRGGQNNPILILFNGAVGRSYHKLYEPFMPFKDELNILLNLKIKNKLDALETKI